MQMLHTCLSRCLAPASKRDLPPLAIWIGVEDDPEFDADRIYDAITPEGWRHEWLGFDEWPSWTPPADERRLLLVAPFMRTDVGRAPDLDQDGWRGSPVLPAAALLRATKRAAPGQRLAALVPDSSFAVAYSEPREQLLSAADLLLLIEGGGIFDNESVGIHGAFRLALLCLEGRAEGTPAGPSRFLRIPRHTAPEDIERELHVLLKQGGGRTDHGFIVRESLELGRPLQFAAHDPVRLERRQHLRALGDVKPLGELAEVFHGRERPLPRSEPEPTDGMPLLSGKDVAARTARDDPRIHRLDIVNPRTPLEVGDMCLPSIGSAEGRPLKIRTIEASDLPMAASNTIIVIRPKVDLGDETREFLVDYLQSPRAAALLRHETTGGLHLKAKQLAELPVPMPDTTLLSALTDLRETAHQLQQWLAEVTNARAAVLGKDAAEVGPLELRSTGQLLRQRVVAARQLDDLGYRIRNLFPFPVALPWRRAQTASRDLEGYQRILQCAETLTAYLAVLAVLLARTIDRSLGTVDALRNKLATTPHGASMAEWTQIVFEAAGKEVAGEAAATTPFVELTELMVEGSDAYDALGGLTKMRNDLSHNRGPTGTQIPAAFDEAFDQLQELYDSCSWLVDYPVRLIEETWWDSYAGSGRYDYRELTGDHYLVQSRSAAIDSPTLNRGRLYVVDRAGALHLMSPLILWHECDHCHLPSAFLLDDFNTKERSCRMRAMDHNHVIHRKDVVAPLVSWGLLPDDAS